MDSTHDLSITRCALYRFATTTALGITILQHKVSIRDKGVNSSGQEWFTFVVKVYLSGPAYNSDLLYSTYKEIKCITLSIDQQLREIQTC